MRRWRPALVAFAALACAILAAAMGTDLRGPAPLTGRLITVGGASGWLILAAASSLALSGAARDMLWTRVGSALAGVVRLSALLAGLLVTLIVTLALLRVPVGSLLLGGTFLGIFLAAAAQQTLGNMFAGVVLTLTRPFSIGGHVRIRAMGMEFAGTVIEVGLTYTKVDAGDHEPVLLPNTLVLSGAIDLAGPPSAGRRRSRGGTSGRGPQKRDSAPGGDHDPTQSVRQPARGQGGGAD